MNSKQRRKFYRVLFSELRSASNSELEQGLIDAAEDKVKADKQIESLRAKVQEWKDAAMNYRQDAIEAQAKNERLRSVISNLLSWIDACADTSPEFCFDSLEEEAKQALATPTSHDALREHDTRLVQDSDNIGLKIISDKMVEE